MATQISGTTGISAPAVNAAGNIQATGNIIGTGVCPVGVVLPFALATTPTGWLACDGTIIPTSGTFQNVDATLLQTLRGLLGTTYGATGQLPNLQGQFIRGLTTNLSTASRDPLSASRVLGNVQTDAFQNITGNLYGTYAALVRGEGGPPSGVFIGSTSASGATASTPTYNTFQPTDFLNFNASNSPGARTSIETRPVNIALLYCIKY
jgi:microcystin-dependent protein